MAEILSSEEALNFLSDNLKIDASYATGVINSSNNNSGQRLDLLNAIIVGLHRTQPFQTLTNIAVEPQLRSLPTPDDIKTDIFAGRGGLCTSINYFCQQLLVAIGYKATFVSGYVCGLFPPMPSTANSHTIIIVRDVQTSGDIYLVDTGLGYATFNAVPLDFTVESPVYRHSFQPFKYIRKSVMEVDSEGNEMETNWFARLHLHGRRLSSNASTSTAAENDVNNYLTKNVINAVNGVWKPFYSFQLQPADYEFIARHVDHSVYRNIECVLSHSIRLIWWPRGRAVIVRDRTLLLEDSEGRLQATELSSDEELVDVILREFPVYYEQLVRRAVAVWNSLPTFAGHAGVDGHVDDRLSGFSRRSGQLFVSN